MQVFSVGPLYAMNMNSRAFMNVNQGGTSSGKTYTIIQCLFTIAMREPNVVVSVVAQDVPNLKRGAFRDAEAIYGRSPELQYFFEKKRGDRIFMGRNNSMIEFVSFEDEQDAKGSKRDYLFVNEADAIPYPVFYQLYLRTNKKIFIDYNPSSRFWVHDKLIGRKDVQLFISDHRHNPFLTPKQHAKIEGIEDPAIWRVYARGMTGQLEGLVFSNWRIVDDLPAVFKKGPYYGLDFGYTADPTACEFVGLQGGMLWIDEYIYEPGLTNPAIAERLKDERVPITAEIIGDSAEMKSIDEIRQLGFRSIEGARKGPDSILNGLDILLRYPICVTRRSSGIIGEFGKYRWLKDKSGRPLNKPIDLFNHGIDAVRYVALNRFAATRKRRRARGGVGAF